MKNKTITLMLVIVLGCIMIWEHFPKKISFRDNYNDYKGFIITQKKEDKQSWWCWVVIQKDNKTKVLKEDYEHFVMYNVGDTINGE